MARLFVVVATVGRAALTRQTVDLLAEQTRLPDGVLVVGASAQDLAGVAEARIGPETALSRRGLCAQRNHALRMLAGRADVITFFDDDFVPAADYLEQVERLFAERPDIVGITGALLADGIQTRGYSFEEATAAVRAAARAPDAPVTPRQALYGCNMSIRAAAAAGLEFDEALPLYGWLEDVDFTTRLGRRGRLIASGRVTGVHMGTKGGRTSGRKLGFPQVANLVHLWRKGTMPPKLGEKLLVQNLAANAARTLWPEPHVDRRGRLAGNMMALADLARGRIDPRRIERI